MRAISAFQSGGRSRVVGVRSQACCRFERCGFNEILFSPAAILTDNSMRTATSRKPRWKEFQSRVAALFNRYPGFSAIENYGAVGARGSISLDVFVRHEHGPLSFSVVVECKLWNSKVPQEKAFALKSVVDDIGASMGIILTQKGVQTGCESYIDACTNLSALR